jgi:hypothetical protein
MPEERPLLPSQPAPEAKPGRPAPVVPEEDYDAVPYDGKSYSSIAERNDERLLNVFVGMYRVTVEKVMGAGTRPYKKEFLRDESDHIYEILFYLTREPKKGRPVTERHLTPVIFKDSRVHALGRYQLKKLRRATSRIVDPSAHNK